MPSGADASLSPGPRVPGALILAGGAGRRLGGVDKGWVQIRGEPLVMRSIRQLAECGWPIAVSANRHLSRYRSLGLRVVEDFHANLPGPLAAISAALRAGFGNPLLTRPVDALEVPAAVYAALLEASTSGARPAYAADAEGDQPLVALWPADALCNVEAALQAGRNSVRALQRDLGAVRVEFDDLVFGNINSPADLELATSGVFASTPC